MKLCSLDVESLLVTPLLLLGGGGDEGGGGGLSAAEAACLEKELILDVSHFSFGDRKKLRTVQL